VAIGTSRITDLLINTFIPVALLYGRLVRDPRIGAGAFSLMESVLRPQDNTVSRVLKRELFDSKITIRSALEHQGSLQLYSRFCSLGRCCACAVGREIKDRNRYLPGVRW
jgi:hypothetical protein